MIIPAESPYQLERRVHRATGLSAVPEVGNKSSSSRIFCFILRCPTSISSEARVALTLCILGMPAANVNFVIETFSISV
jgi:hypothetical protein